MTLNTEFGWQPERTEDRKFKAVSKSKMRAMGLEPNIKPWVADFDELRKSPPNIIVAESTDTLKFVQNYFKTQTLKKREKYVMGLGVYQQLHADPRIASKKFLKPAKIKFKNIYRPYKGQDMDNKTLLVFRTGGIGDLLFIQPNLLYLKEKYPTCKIKFACGPQYQSMVETWDCVDEVLDLPFEFKQLVQADYHALFEGVIERCKLSENVNAYNLFTEWLGLNLPDELLVPKQDAKSELVDFCSEKLKEWGVEPHKFILMQLRASSPIRTPRPLLWKNIIDGLTDQGYKIVLTDSPRQAEHVDGFIKYVKDPTKVFNFCKHSESLDYSIALTKLAGLIVGTDSAMNHIAASLGVPCYGLYGPFPGHIRLKTYSNTKWIDAVRPCAPCYVHGQSSCKEAGKDGYSPCYDNLDIDTILKDVGSLLPND